MLTFSPIEWLQNNFKKNNKADDFGTFCKFQNYMIIFYRDETQTLTSVDKSTFKERGYVCASPHYFGNL